MIYKGYEIKPMPPGQYGYPCRPHKVGAYKNGELVFTAKDFFWCALAINTLTNPRYD